MRKRFALDAMNRQMKEYGWIVTGVPGLAIYTVGLVDKFHHPELMIHGLGVEKSYALLSNAEHLIAEGKVLRAGDLVDQIITRTSDGAPLYCKMISVDVSNYFDWLGQMADYNGMDAGALQILWPDTMGRFPGDQDYEKRFNQQKRFDVRRPEYDWPVKHTTDHGVKVHTHSQTTIED